MGKGVDIENLLEKLAKGSSSGRSTESKSDMTDQQMADKLLTSFVAFSQPPTLKAGDFVRYRKEVNQYVRNHSRLHVVMALIDPPIKVPVTDDNEGGPTCYRQYDVVVGVCNGDSNESIMKYLADRRELELFPDGDRLKRQGTA